MTRSARRYILQLFIIRSSTNVSICLCPTPMYAACHCPLWLVSIVKHASVMSFTRGPIVHRCFVIIHTWYSGIIERTQLPRFYHVTLFSSRDMLHISTIYSKNFNPVTLCLSSPPSLPCCLTNHLFLLFHLGRLARHFADLMLYFRGKYLLPAAVCLAALSVAHSSHLVVLTKRVTKFCAPEYLFSFG